MDQSIATHTQFVPMLRDEIPFYFWTFYFALTLDLEIGQEMSIHVPFECYEMMWLSANQHVVLQLIWLVIHDDSRYHFQFPLLIDSPKWLSLTMMSTVGWLLFLKKAKNHITIRMYNTQHTTYERTKSDTCHWNDFAHSRHRLYLDAQSWLYCNWHQRQHQHQC